jgi:hypothetical protein
MAGVEVVTLVKKIMEDGSECRKCQAVTRLLEEKGLIDRINKIVFADPKDPEGEGMKMVRFWNMRRAPFFIVEEPGRTAIYSSVMELIRKELQRI